MISVSNQLTYEIQGESHCFCYECEDTQKWLRQKYLSHAEGPKVTVRRLVDGQNMSVKEEQKKQRLQQELGQSDVNLRQV